MITHLINNCLCCQKPLKGRSDKKFCNDYCRNQYNNQLKAPSNNLVRNINFALGKNRRIMENLIPAGEDMFRVSRDKMLQSGFRFLYNTHTYTNKKGSVYHFCYEFGYLPLDNEWILLVKAKEE